MTHLNTSLILLALLVALTAPACLVDGLILTQVLDEEHDIPSDPSPSILRGAVDEDRSGDLSFWSASGSKIIPQESILGDNGFYEASFAGTDEFTALRVATTNGASVAYGLVPYIPRAPSVRSPKILIDLKNDLPTMAVIGDETTTITLVIEAKSRESGGLASLSPAQLTTLIEALGKDIFAPGPLLDLRQMVTSLQEAAIAAPPGTPTVFLMPDKTTEGSSVLNAEFLQRVSVDYDNDGAPNTDSQVFDALLAEIAAGLELNSCIEESRIRLVFQLDLNEGQKDLNCEVIDPFAWVNPDPGDGVFFTGAVHVDQPNCTEFPDDPFCLTEEEISVTSQLMGDFTPNQVAMTDDGTQGDAVAGDNIWTVVFEVPRGVYIGYKYTYAKGGEGWTAAEEWPGNSRLLKAVDLDGDNLVVRRDYFGDESSNKDKQNSLSPNRGGRGTIDFETDADGDGRIEARENLIDTDGDCIADTAPQVGPVSPVFCEE